MDQLHSITAVLRVLQTLPFDKTIIHPLLYNIIVYYIRNIYQEDMYRYEQLAIFSNLL